MTVAFLHFVRVCPPLYYVFLRYGWSPSVWNLTWDSWFLLNRLQRLANHVVLKLSSLIENNLLQKLHEIAVNSSYISLPISKTLINSECRGDRLGLIFLAPIKPSLLLSYFLCPKTIYLSLSFYIYPKDPRFWF